MKKLKRVLIVSPHFPPTNAADSQRARMAIPYFERNNWQAEVLCIHPDCISMAQDPWLLKTLPTRLKIHSVYAETAFRKLAAKSIGINSLWFRFGPAFDRRGTQLLASGNFDLVFFTTTQFPFMSLGVRWKKMFSVPYVLDYQDPWVNDYYLRTSTAPPGGWFRYLPQYINAKRLEPQTVRQAGGIISVSPNYLLSLRKYNAHPVQKVLPFGAPIHDLSLLPDLFVETEKESNPRKTWVYIGRGGPDLLLQLKCFFRAIKTILHKNNTPINIKFIGTNYYGNSSSKKPIEQLAIQCGLMGVVFEFPERVSYSEAIQQMKRADVILIIGSNDSAYSPSKIYPAMMCKRPLLAVGDSESKVHEFVRRFSAGEHFITDQPESTIAAIEWALNQDYRKPFTDINREEFKQITAPAMTNRLCWVFDRAIENAS
ncbi:MAG: hypothetical protein ACFCU1_00890 [Sumerlaeia bacterium]